MSGVENARGLTNTGGAASGNLTKRRKCDRMGVTAREAP